MSNITSGAAARRESARGHGTKPGEFGYQAHSAPEESAFDAGPNWGEVTIAEGDKSPWGEVQHVDHLADGIAAVDTDGHGGVKLSPERNRKIPDAWRSKGGWHEEDCEHYFVRATFPEAFVRDEATAMTTQVDAEERIRYWFPDQWEAETGEAILPGQSAERDRQLARAAAAGDFVARGAWPADDDMVCVSARRESTGEERQFLVPKSEYSDRGDLGFVVADPDAYEEHSVADAPPSLAPPMSAGTFDTWNCTPGAKTRAERELAKLVRDEDGTVSTFEEYLRRSEVHGKTAMVGDDGRTSYYLSLPDSRVAPVSKAVWDASLAPSELTPEREAANRLHVAQAKLDKLERAQDRAPFGRTTMAEQEQLRQTRQARDGYQVAASAAREAADEVRRTERESIDAQITRSTYAAELAATLTRLERTADGRVSPDSDPGTLRRFQLLTEHGAANGYLRTPPTTEGR
ncbi:DUF7007 domain-containing protein [Pseudoclavibacter terrae]|uniref:DUF7007 domain-containing protein n=1 Tax=Pseudoclavibacter terrae TaxID=1530195 RepID=UPI00232B99C0|nr:hypothetical protein [Pseudoclavibacter terrae]